MPNYLKMARPLFENYFFVLIVYIIFWGVYQFITDVWGMLEVSFQESIICNGNISAELAEAVRKFSTQISESQQTVDSSATQDSFCSITYGSMIKYLAAPAFVLVILLSFFTKRRFVKPNICGGRPGIPIAVNLLDEYENRLDYLAVFGVTAMSLIDLFRGEYYVEVPNPSGSPWITIFVGVINVAWVGLVFYPIFGCITCESRAFGAFVGMCYTGGWLTFWVWQLISCPITTTKPKDIAVFALTYGPLLVFFAVLVIRFIMFLIIQSRKAIIKRGLEDTDMQKFLTRKKKRLEGFQFDYVRRLLKRDDPDENDIEEEKTLLQKTKDMCCNIYKKNIYKSRSDFKYSLRSLATFYAGGYAVYAFSVQYLRIGTKYTYFAKLFILSLDPLVEPTNSTEIREELFQLLKAFDASFYISAILSTIIMILLIARMMAVYRNHMMRLYKGDNSFMPPRLPAPPALMVSCLRYSGYQIGYIIWGFFFILISIFVFCVIFAYQIFIPIAMGKQSSFMKEINLIWPSTVLTIVLFGSQIILSKFAFLQENGNVVALNNRRLFHVFSYFTFFLNVILGLLSCLLRAIKSVFLGIMSLPRIDHSIMTRDYELMDNGYKSYLGFLRIQLIHCHPVMVAFCKILLNEIEIHKTQTKSEAKMEIRLNTVNQLFDITGGGSKVIPFKKPKERNAMFNPVANYVAGSKLARNRWWIAVTLINNPSMKKLRHPVAVSTTEKKNGFSDMDFDL